MENEKKPLTEARKKANAKWNKENRVTLGVNLSRIEAEAFKEYAEARGTTANALFRDYVRQCLAEDNATAEPGPAEQPKTAQNTAEQNT